LESSGRIGEALMCLFTAATGENQKGEKNNR
jgi:hypothetical protein